MADTRPYLPRSSAWFGMGGLVAAGHVQEAMWGWNRLRGRTPVGVDLLACTFSGTTVVRLVGAGPRGASVIAKRHRVARAEIEWRIYADVLPHVPVLAPRAYGQADGGAGFRWTYIDDAGSHRYSRFDPEHRDAAARWLAGLHTAGAQLAPRPPLPVRGASHYLRHLRDARARLRRHRSDPMLMRAHRRTLDALTEQCDRIESTWPEIQTLSARMPCTVVHGDFVPKNVRVARRAGRLVVLPFDWETAGWGPPAADLASFQKGIRPDLTHYANAVAGAWPGLGIDDLMAMSDLGRLFRVLAAIDWASVGLTDRSAGYAAEELDYFVTELEDWQMPV